MSTGPGPAGSRCTESGRAASGQAGQVPGRATGRPEVEHLLAQAEVLAPDADELLGRLGMAAGAFTSLTDAALDMFFARYAPPPAAAAASLESAPWQQAARS